MIGRRDVEKALAAISKDIAPTPLALSRRLSELCACEILLKLENMQPTGSFKERGALNKLLALSPEERRRGVIAASAGNHAQGVARHASRLGIRSTIVMPRGTPLVKVGATQNYGAEVVIHGESYDDASEHALQLAAAEGAVLIHPFDDPLVIAGQGTIAAEILADERCRDLDTIVCPVGGGGLISGIAAYAKEVRPSIRIIGVEAEVCPCLLRAREAGRPVKLESASSLADGIAVRQVGTLTLEIAQRYVDDVVTVSEDEIAHAVLTLLEMEKLVVEGAGGAPLAALINHKAPSPGRKVLCVVSGGNIDVNILNRIITRGLAFEGRTVQFKVRLRDVPGALKRALEVLERLNTNVLDIIHHRFDTRPPFGSVDVTLTLETRGHDHIRQIEDALRREGYFR